MAIAKTTGSVQQAELPPHVRELISLTSDFAFPDSTLTSMYELALVVFRLFRPSYEWSPSDEEIATKTIQVTIQDIALTPSMNWIIAKLNGRAEYNAFTADDMAKIAMVVHFVIYSEYVNADDYDVPEDIAKLANNDLYETLRQGGGTTQGGQVVIPTTTVSDNPAGDTGTKIEVTAKPTKWQETKQVFMKWAKGDIDTGNQKGFYDGEDTLADLLVRKLRNAVANAGNGKIHNFVGENLYIPSAATVGSAADYLNPAKMTERFFLPDRNPTEPWYDRLNDKLKDTTVLTFGKDKKVTMDHIAKGAIGLAILALWLFNRSDSDSGNAPGEQPLPVIPERYGWLGQPVQALLAPHVSDTSMHWPSFGYHIQTAEGEDLEDHLRKELQGFGYSAKEVDDTVKKILSLESNVIWKTRGYSEKTDWMNINELYNPTRTGTTARRGVTYEKIGADSSAIVMHLPNNNHSFQLAQSFLKPSYGMTGNNDNDPMLFDMTDKATYCKIRIKRQEIIKDTTPAYCFSEICNLTYSRTDVDDFVEALFGITETDWTETTVGYCIEACELEKDADGKYTGNINYVIPSNTYRLKVRWFPIYNAWLPAIEFDSADNGGPPPYNRPIPIASGRKLSIQETNVIGANPNLKIPIPILMGQRTKEKLKTGNNATVKSIAEERVSPFRPGYVLREFEPVNPDDPNSSKKLKSAKLILLNTSLETLNAPDNMELVHCYVPPTDKKSSTLFNLTKHILATGNNAAVEFVDDGAEEKWQRDSGNGSFWFDLLMAGVMIAGAIPADN